MLKGYAVRVLVITDKIYSEKVEKVSAYDWPLVIANYVNDKNCF